MAVGYFGTKISDNIIKTPEGYLLARSCVLARTGAMRYMVNELSEDVQKLLDAPADAQIDLFRTQEDVFNPASLSSLEGKPVTDNHPPGKTWVNPGNIEQLQKGHVQNVHRGDEPLESGDWPLMGDLMITHEPLISKVIGGLRSISLGYDFTPVIDGDQLRQTNILYNHAAVLQQGRAGPEARINDAAPVIEKDPPVETAVVEIKTTDKCVSCESGDCLIHQQVSEPEARQQSTHKEKAKVPITDWFKHVTGLGLKALATDADTKPEQLTDAMTAISRMRVADEDKEEKKEEAEDRHMDDHRRRADDRRMDDRKMDDHKADDHKSDDAAIKHAGDCPCKDCMAMDHRKKADDKKADDHKMDDHRVRDRKRMHAALDKMLLESGEEEPVQEESEDADMQELRKLMDQYMGEEAGEPEHAMDKEEGEGEVKEEEKKEETEKATDERAEIYEPADLEAARAAIADQELSYLKTIRPRVAKATDAALKRDGLPTKKEFNARWRALTGKSKPSNGGYGQFAQATTERAKDGKAPIDPYAKLNAAYEKLHANYQEVK